MTDPLDLAPLEEALPADRHPAAVYLARLAPRSRYTQRGALATMASLLAPGCPLEAFPWQALRYQHTAALRALLVARYAPATASRMLAALRGVLREAWRLGLLPGEDYRRAVDLERVRGSRLPAGRALEPEELARLSLAAGEGPRGDRDRALLALLYGAGLRRAEACALAWGAVATGAVRLVGKGGREREVPLPGWARESLEAWAGRGGREGAILRSVGQRGRIGPSLSPTGALQALQALARRAGVDRLSPHDLRRTYVSALLDAGADLASVQALAGHSSPATTAIYDRRGERARKAAAEKLPKP